MKKFLIGLILSVVTLFSAVSLTGCSGIFSGYDVYVTNNLGAETVLEGTYKNGRTVTLIAAPIKGHNFAQWEFNGVMVSTEREFAFQMRKELAGTYTAVYEAKTFTIGYGSDNITLDVASGSQVKYNTEVRVTWIYPPKEGFFAKTYYRGFPDIGTKYYFTDSFLVPDWNISVYVDYVPEYYSIVYELNGGRFEGDYKTKYKDTESDFILPTPIRDGYVFTGWTSTNIYTPTPIKNLVIPTGSMGDKTFYANWRLENTGEVRVTVATNGYLAVESHGQVFEYVDFEYGSTARLICNPREGYKVSRIYYIMEGTTEEVDIVEHLEGTNIWEFVMPNGNVLVYAETMPL